MVLISFIFNYLPRLNNEVMLVLCPRDFLLEVGSSKHGSFSYKPSQQPTTKSLSLSRAPLSLNQATPAQPNPIQYQRQRQPCLVLSCLVSTCPCPVQPLLSSFYFSFFLAVLVPPQPRHYCYYLVTVRPSPSTHSPSLLFDHASSWNCTHWQYID